MFNYPNNYYNGYQPAQPMYATPPDMPGTFRGRQEQPQNQGGSGLIWVQGMEGAKSYPVAPGNSVMLMDSENRVFYIKSADASGMPMPLRIFDFTERTPNAPAGQAAPEAPAVDLSSYVTREEFDALKEQLEKLKPADSDNKNSGSKK